MMRFLLEVLLRQAQYSCSSENTFSRLFASSKCGKLGSLSTIKLETDMIDVNFFLAIVSKVREKFSALVELNKHRFTYEFGDAILKHVTDTINGNDNTSIDNAIHVALAEIIPRWISLRDDDGNSLLLYLLLHDTQIEYVEIAINVGMNIHASNFKGRSVLDEFVDRYTGEGDAVTIIDEVIAINDRRKSASMNDDAYSVRNTIISRYPELRADVLIVHQFMEYVIYNISMGKDMDSAIFHALRMWKSVHDNQGRTMAFYIGSHFLLEKMYSEFGYDVDEQDIYGKTVLDYLI